MIANLGLARIIWIGPERPALGPGPRKCLPRGIQNKRLAEPVVTRQQIQPLAQVQLHCWVGPEVFEVEAF